LIAPVLTTKQQRAQNSTDDLPLMLQTIITAQFCVNVKKICVHCELCRSQTVGSDGLKHVLAAQQVTVLVINHVMIRNQ